MIKKELIEKITQNYNRLFPLVLLALSDDPMPAIGEYLEIEEEKPKKKKSKLKYSLEVKNKTYYHMEDKRDLDGKVHEGVSDHYLMQFNSFSGSYDPTSLPMPLFSNSSKPSFRSSPL